MAGLQKILLVEDNNELRMMYEIYLSGNGYTVECAIDGLDGLEKAKSFKPELIFLDVMMPKMNGFDVLKKLRHEPEFGNTETIIIILTNLGDANKVPADVSEDMDAYVVKAEIQLSDLVDIIHHFEK